MCRINCVGYNLHIGAHKIHMVEVGLRVEMQGCQLPEGWWGEGGEKEREFPSPPSSSLPWPWQVWDRAEGGASLPAAA